MMEWEISKEESGIKLLVFLKNHLDDKFSARQIKDALERGSCLINQRVERFASTLLGEGDRVTFHLELMVRSKELVSVDKSQALYVDEDLLIYHKPEGIASNDPSFLKGIQAFFPGAELVHRLDKETTGALLFARNSETYRGLISLFKTREMTKTYLAIVDGYLKKHSGVIENYLGKLRSYHGQTIWGTVAEHRGLFAKTAWTVKKKGNQASLLRCYPETGRTHQIRVHLSEMGHPILGDYQYGRQFKCSYVPPRYLLHALEISFVHPRKRRILTVKAPLPGDFQEAIDFLFGKK